jgi:hypothetical protein
LAGAQLGQRSAGSAVTPILALLAIVITVFIAQRSAAVLAAGRAHARPRWCARKSVRPHLPRTGVLAVTSSTSSRLAGTSVQRRRLVHPIQRDRDHRPHALHREARLLGRMTGDRHGAVDTIVVPAALDGDASTRRSRW